MWSPKPLSFPSSPLGIAALAPGQLQRLGGLGWEWGVKCHFLRKTSLSHPTFTLSDLGRSKLQIGLSLCLPARTSLQPTPESLPLVAKADGQGESRRPVSGWHWAPSFFLP